MNTAEVREQHRIGAKAMDLIDIDRGPARQPLFAATLLHFASSGFLV